MSQNPVRMRTSPSPAIPTHIAFCMPHTFPSILSRQGITWGEWRLENGAATESGIKYFRRGSTGQDGKAKAYDLANLVIHETCPFDTHHHHLKRSSAPWRHNVCSPIYGARVDCSHKHRILRYTRRTLRGDYYQLAAHC